MAQPETARDGGFDSTYGDTGGTDWWAQSPTADITLSPTREGTPLLPPVEDLSAPPHREVAGRATAVDFGIAEWTPYHRPWYRKPRVLAVIGAVVAVAVTAVVVMVSRDGSATGDETTVAPPAPTSSSPGATTVPPNSAGTPQTALLPPPPPPPLTAEQITPPPVARQWPRYEPPSQTKPAAPTVSSPPSMSFAPKPVTPPQTATPGQNRGGHHGFF